MRRIAFERAAQCAAKDGETEEHDADGVDAFHHGGLSFRPAQAPRNIMTWNVRLPYVN
jgi:hypothetical protein